MAFMKFIGAAPALEVVLNVEDKNVEFCVVQNTVLQNTEQPTGEVRREFLYLEEDFPMLGKSSLPRVEVESSLPRVEVEGGISSVKNDNTILGMEVHDDGGAKLAKWVGGEIWCVECEGIRGDIRGVDVHKHAHGLGFI